MEGDANIHEGNFQRMNSQQERFFGPNALGRDSRMTRNSIARHGTIKHRDVEELEMLLEAYFVHIDGTLHKLSTVCHSIFYISIKKASHLFICYKIHEIC